VESNQLSFTRGRTSFQLDDDESRGQSSSAVRVTGLNSQDHAVRSFVQIKLLAGNMSRGRGRVGEWEFIAGIREEDLGYDLGD
jgi:hypothetical protein